MRLGWVGGVVACALAGCTLITEKAIGVKVGVGGASIDTGADTDLPGDSASNADTGGDTGPDSGSDTDTDAPVTYTGEAAGDVAGCAVAGAGDVNGDGYDDVLVGAFRNDDGGLDAGAAYVVLGTAHPADAGLSASVEYYGVAAGDAAGISVAGAGDVNGDGYDDMLVGGYTVNAYLVLGSATPASSSLSDAVPLATHGQAAAVAPAGDVNGDGFYDMLVAGGSDAYLVLGSASPTSESLSDGITYSGAASSVADAGDVDGDGVLDAWIGNAANSDAASSAGAAFLVLGSSSPASSSLSSAVEYRGEAANDEAGYAVSGAGDANGDGYADMLVGAIWNDDAGDDAGAAYLVLGGASPASSGLSSAVRYTGAAGSWAGYSISPTGDMDGDGFDDALVSAAQSEGGGIAGAWLVPGNAAPASASLADTPLVYSGASNAVSAAGDVNKDGRPDAVVGNGYDGAGVYLILGIGL